MAHGKDNSEARRTQHHAEVRRVVKFAHGSRAARGLRDQHPQAEPMTTTPAPHLPSEESEALRKARAEKEDFVRQIGSLREQLERMEEQLSQARDAARQARVSEARLSKENDDLREQLKAAQQQNKHAWASVSGEMERRHETMHESHRGSETFKEEPNSKGKREHKRSQCDGVNKRTRLDEARHWTSEEGGHSEHDRCVDFLYNVQPSPPKDAPCSKFDGSSTHSATSLWSLMDLYMEAAHTSDSSPEADGDLCKRLVAGHRQYTATRIFGHPEVPRDFYALLVRNMGTDVGYIMRKLSERESDDDASAPQFPPPSPF